MKLVRTIILMTLFTCTLFAANFFETEVFYSVGDRVEYNEKEYQCTFAHTSQSAWAPGTPEIWFWYEVSAVDGGWIAGTAYVNGDIVAYEELTYKCIISHTALPGWEPTGSVLWELAEELTVTDYDGNIYSTIQIGEQIWTVENLKVTHYRNGDPIPNATDNSGWKNTVGGVYCYYDNDETNMQKYGALYNWNAVDDVRGLAPEGWHIPTESEWKVLADYLESNGYGHEGIGSDISKSMAAKTDWNSSSISGTPGDDIATNNSSNFSALPGGFRNNSGNFLIGYRGYWWTTTVGSREKPYCSYLNYGDSNLISLPFDKGCGLSVRLVRD